MVEPIKQAQGAGLGGFHQRDGLRDLLRVLAHLEYREHRFGESFFWNREPDSVRACISDKIHTLTDPRRLWSLKNTHYSLCMRSARMSRLPWRAFTLCHVPTRFGTETRRAEPKTQRACCMSRRVSQPQIQGYLAHKKHPPPRTLQLDCT